MKQSRFLTYALPREFFGMSIPIPIQSAYLRDYASRSKLNFHLPVTEVCFGDSYYSLSNLFRIIEDGDHFGAVSILCLPLKEIATLVQILNLLAGKSIHFHFPLEGFSGSNCKILECRESFIMMRKQSNKSLNALRSEYL